MSLIEWDKLHARTSFHLVLLRLGQLKDTVDEMENSDYEKEDFNKNMMGKKEGELKVESEEDIRLFLFIGITSINI